MCWIAVIPSDLSTTRDEGEMIWANSTTGFCLRIGFGASLDSVLCRWIAKVSAPRLGDGFSLPAEVSAEMIVASGIKMPYFRENLGRWGRGVVAGVAVGEEGV